MRPQVLFPLFAQLTSLPGIGPRFAKLLEGLCGPHVADLLWHRPSALIDRRFHPKVVEAPAGVIATLTVTVDAHVKPYHPRQPYRVRCRDETGFLHLVFFHVKGDYLERLLPIGAVRVVSGRVEHFNNQIQITHPDHIVDAAAAEKLPAIEPVYPLTAGLPLRTVQKAVTAALSRAPMLPEWTEPTLLAQRNWPSWREAVLALHAPASEADLLPETPARERLAYDELMANQLAIALVRAHTKRLPGRMLKAPGALRERAIAALPYKLTGSQRQASAEIAGDMAATHRMLRLLQGDVGSGKTVVALIAMLDAVEAGAQAALMAPTEILARQHHATLLGAGGTRGRLGGAAHGARERQDARGTARRLALRRDADRSRYARALPGRRRVQGPRLCRHRRAAPLRRRAARGALGQGQGRRYPCDDGDADPAHPDARGLWRYGALAPDREAGRPPADRHAHGAARAARGSGRRHRPRARRRRQDLLDLPAGRGIRAGGPRRRRRAPGLSEGALRQSRRPGARAHEGAAEGRGHGGLRARRQIDLCWSRPRWSRWASTCPTPP